MANRLNTQADPGFFLIIRQFNAELIVERVVIGVHLFHLSSLQLDLGHIQTSEKHAWIIGRAGNSMVGHLLDIMKVPVSIVAFQKNLIVVFEAYR